MNRFTHALPGTGKKARVVITGGAGFIGSHVVDLFLQNGHPVIAIDDLSTGSLANLDLAQRHPSFDFIRGDVANIDWLKLLQRQDTVIHLAAAVGVKKVCESALATAHNNHIPLELILRAISEKKSSGLLYASTSEVYGDSPSEGSSEEDMLQVHTHLGGRSAYTVSKLYGELIALAYAEAHGIPITVMRFFNTIGPRQRSDYGMVAPVFVKQALSGQPISVYGDGRQTRSFCAVQDVADAVYGLFEARFAGGRVFNIGNPCEITMLALAQFVKREVGSDAAIDFLPFPPERAGKTDIRNRKPNIERIAQAIGWEPQWSWQDAIRSIIYEQAPFHEQCIHH